IIGKYSKKHLDENQQLDFTQPDKTYIYAYKNKIEAYNDKHLKIITYFKEKNQKPENIRQQLSDDPENIRQQLSDGPENIRQQLSDDPENIRQQLSDGPEKSEKSSNSEHENSEHENSEQENSEQEKSEQKKSSNLEQEKTSNLEKQHDKSEKPSNLENTKQVKRIRVYNKEIAPIMDLGNIFIYKKHCLIQNVVFFDSHKKFSIAVTPESLFMIYKDIVICKSEMNVIGADLLEMEYFTIEKALQKKTMADLCFLLGLFFDWDIKIKNNKLFVRILLTESQKYIKLEQIENILVQLLLMNYHKFVEPFLNEIFSLEIEKNNEQIEKLYCNLFRRVDDKNREYLRKFTVNIRCVKNLYKIILYVPEKLENFLDLAIKQKKEYFINEIISFYKKQNQKGALEKLKVFLLTKNQFYLYSLIDDDERLKEITDILKSEKNQIRSHYLRDVFSKRTE
ncbi:hypothetical protein M153_13290002964, partial [Pseudoloma neurophilia]